MAQLARVASNIASNNRRVFVIGVGMTKVRQFSIFYLQIIRQGDRTLIVDRCIVFYIFVKQFEKPGRRDNFDYPDMAHEAVSKALKDAKIDYSQIKQAAVGYVYGEQNSIKMKTMRQT